MKKQTTILSLVLSAFVSFNAISQQLSPVDFEKGLAGKTSQLLDVRTAGEYKSGHIAHSLQADWNNQDQFKSRAMHLDKSKPVYVYCASGGRSRSAAQWLRTNGYSQVYELTGGFIKWKGEGKPVEGMPDTQPMTTEAFNTAISGPGIVLVDCGAEWCAPCRKMDDVLQSLQKDLAGKYKLVKIDAGVDTGLMKEIKATELPTFILYKNGKEVWRKTGVVELAELKSQINHQ
jgi:rhodanese-related sulfurtransferase